MHNANPPQKRSEEQGSRIPERPAQQSARQGFAPASIIERAAQRLDSTIAFGIRHSTPHGPEEITHERPRPGSRIARASRLGSRGPRGLRLRLISRLYLASVLVGAAACAGFFLLTHSVDEKATAERARATDLPTQATEATYLIRGLAVMPPAVGTAQSDSLAGPAPISAASDLQAKLSPAPIQPAGCADLFQRGDRCPSGAWRLVVRHGRCCFGTSFVRACRRCGRSACCGEVRGDFRPCLSEPSQLARRAR